MDLARPAPCRGYSLEPHVLDGTHHRAVPEQYCWPEQLEIPRPSRGNVHTLTLGLPPNWLEKAQTTLQKV